MAKKKKTGRKLISGPEAMKLFEARLKRIGTHDAFIARAKQYVANCRQKRGISYGKDRVKKKFGYDSIEAEMEAEDDRLAKVQRDKEELFKRIGYSPDGNDPQQVRFEKEIATLPLEAPDADEVNWIRRHAAMVRLDNSDSALVRITLDDVFNTPAGVAPSQRAVYDLIHWSKNPTAFRNAVLSGQKKKMENRPDETEDEKVDSEYHDDLEKTKRILMKLCPAGICPSCKRPVEEPEAETV